MAIAVNKTGKIISAVFAVGLISLLGVLWFSEPGFKRAPGVSFKMLDGDTISINDLSRPTMVTFWATTCPSCIKEVPHLIELHEKFNKSGFDILAVAMRYDPPEQVRLFQKNRNVPYKIALDTNGQAAKAFGNVSLTPTTFVIDPDNRIVYSKVGEFDTALMINRIQSLVRMKDS